MSRELQRVSNVATPIGGAIPLKTAALGNTGISSVAKACRVYSLSFFNADSNAAYAKVYNKASAATSSDTPVQVFLVKAGETLVVPISAAGLNFENGLSFRGVALTGGNADNSATGATASTLYANYAYSSK